jgi:probable F420-dependent oxidoreductase
MKFGVGISTCREGLFYPVGFASIENLRLVTQRAEALGYDAVWGNDHFTTQTYLKDRGEKPNFYEPLIVFSHLSTVTKCIKLGTAILVGPIRNPVVLAKQAITLDHVSGGRFVLGIGLGAYREEFEAYGGKGNRGAILDESVAALRELFDKPLASFHGKYIQFSEIELYPRPLQDPFPIYIGGNASTVLKRVVLYGNGWLPASLTPEELAKAIEKIREYAKTVRRDPDKIEVAPEFGCSISKESASARRNFFNSPMYHHILSLRASTFKDLKSFNAEELLKRNFVGSPNEIIKKLELYEAAGVHHIWFDFIAPTADEVLERMGLFAESVFPLFK